MVRLLEGCSTLTDSIFLSRPPYTASLVGKLAHSFFFLLLFFQTKYSSLYKWRFFSRENKCFRHFFPLIAQEKMQPKGHRASREGIVATHFKLKRVDGVGGAALQSTQWENT